MQKKQENEQILAMTLFVGDTFTLPRVRYKLTCTQEPQVLNSKVVIHSETRNGQYKRVELTKDALVILHTKDTR